ncbi:MAG: right-handed parallel beta-helix repeat-containing protein [Victivallales bacterium]|jgi:hypothetical protein
MIMKKTVLSALCMIAAGCLFSADWYVDNTKGNDSNAGSKDAPFLTIKCGMDRMKGGDTLHLTPNSEPYREKIGSFEKNLSGTPDKPTVVDGHDARIELIKHFNAEMWKPEGDDIYSLKYPNNCVAMFAKGYYAGFPFVRLDGKLIPCVTKREELQENTCLLILHYDVAKKGFSDLHNYLFVKLPPGKTPADVKIEAPDNNNCLVNGSYITIKNLTAEWNASDSFDSSRGTGIVFENVKAAWCMDQCISAHSTAGADIRFSSFANALCGGCLDVTFQNGESCNVRYYGCFFGPNASAGFKGTGKGYEMNSCILRDGYVSVQGEAVLKLTNCVIIKESDRSKANSANVGVSVTDKGSLIMENCTVIGFKHGGFFSTVGTVSIKNCVFIDCETNLLFMKDLSAELFSSTDNVFAPKGLYQVGNSKFKTLDEVNAKYQFDKGSVAVPGGYKGKGCNLDPKLTFEQLKTLLQTAVK